MNSVKFANRLKAIDRAIKVLEAEQAKHMPYILFQPWDMLNDQYNIVYHPEGKYQKPVTNERVTYTEAKDILQGYPGSLLCQVSMGECIEWLFSFHFKDGRNGYAGEIRDACTEKYLCDNPLLQQLVSTEWGEKMMQILCQIPQVSIIRLQNLVDAFTE